MPELVRLYIRNIVAGAVLSFVFVALLMAFDVAHLRRLILGSDIGYIAVALLFVFNTVVFSGVQFGIAVMRMGADHTPPGGGKRDAIPAGMERATAMIAIPVPVQTDRRRIGNRKF